MTSRAAAVVLAAGRATRFGDTKQVARIAGRALVAHVVDAALDAGLPEVVVVVGHDAERVTAALPDDPRVRTVTNPRYAEGQASSLRTGLDALPADVEVAVIVLADQPGVTAAAVAAVGAAVGPDRPVARALYDDGPSHPVAFHRSVWPRLSRLSGDAGARQVLDDLEVHAVRLPGDAPPDVDAPADLPAG